MQSEIIYFVRLTFHKVFTPYASYLFIASQLLTPLLCPALWYWHWTL